MFVYPGASTAAVGPSMEKNSLISEMDEGKPHSMFQQAGCHGGFNSRCVSMRGGAGRKKKVLMNRGTCLFAWFICQETYLARTKRQCDFNNTQEGSYLAKCIKGPTHPFWNPIRFESFDRAFTRKLLLFENSKGSSITRDVEGSRNHE